jgi:hypothetical protein
VDELCHPRRDRGVRQAPPWTAADGDRDLRRYAPATSRNRDVIVDLLAEALPSAGLVLEIASGSGEHVVHFARAFPALDWQPSDPDPDALASILAWSGQAALTNLRPPVMLDAGAPDWPVDHCEALLCINMIHISPWEAALGLLRGGARILPAGGLLYLYGPYMRDGVETAPSNLAFDASLKARDPRWGLRRLEDVTAAADGEGLAFERLVEMPANNLSLIYRKA